MPLVHSLDPGRNCLLCRATGPITYEEIQKHLDAERLDRFLGYAELIDATAATVAFSGEEVRRIVETLRSLSAHQRLGPTAIVVQGDLAYGVMRMLELLVERICAIRPFRTFEEAEAWLAEFAKPAARESAG